ncbi:MAG: Uma2 family endonuclease [Chloroflexi bacterium]|nr:Uma2 family endonuclease [Chloroflexota bacterium]
MVAQTKPVTVEEFDTFVTLPENHERLFEFIGGEIVAVVSNNYSSLLGMRVGGRMLVFVEQHDLGYVTGTDGGYRVSGERYIPDVAFVSKQRQPQPSREAYNPIAPDLAVEVLSPTNDESDMRFKVVNYLRAGTMVWVVNPDRKQVEVYAPNAAPRTIGIDGVLDGGEVLPGFTLAVKDIFPEEQL